MAPSAQVLTPPAAAHREPLARTRESELPYSSPLVPGGTTSKATGFQSDRQNGGAGLTRTGLRTNRRTSVSFGRRPPEESHRWELP